MKKLLVLSVFIALGAVAFAQTPSKKEAPKASTSLTVAQPAAVEAVAATNDVLDTKKGTKKECSAEEKKACGTKSGKKACCSSGNSDIKKEEAK